MRPEITVRREGLVFKTDWVAQPGIGLRVFVSAATENGADSERDTYRFLRVRKGNKQLRVSDLLRPPS